jgi:hypothetical protein
MASLSFPSLACDELSLVDGRGFIRLWWKKGRVKLLDFSPPPQSSPIKGEEGV